MPESKTKTAETSTNGVDDSPFLFDVSDPWLRSLSYGYISNFLGRVKRTTPLAYKIAYHAQEEGSYFDEDVFFPLNLSVNISTQARSQLAKYEIGLGHSEAAFEEILASIKHEAAEEKRLEAEIKERHDLYVGLKAKKETIPDGMAAQVLADSKRKKRSKTVARYKNGPKDSEAKNGAHPFDWIFLQRHFRDESAKLARESSPEKRPASFVNIMGLSERFGFTTLQRDFLTLLICRAEVKEFSGFIKGVVGSKIEFDLELMARMVSATKEALLDELKITSPLVRSGMVMIEEDEIPKISKDIYKRLNRPGLSFAQIVEDISGTERTPKLGLENYPHIRRDVDLAVTFLTNATGGVQPEPGTNILLYGPPGTGKTELAPIIAAALGRKLRCPGEKSKDGTKALPRGERLASILLALSVESNDILCFDEMEDVLPAGMDTADKDKNVSGKVFLNRLLEENKRPVIWIMNHPELLSEAVLRRFSYSIFVPTPPISVRAQMYATISKGAGRPLGDDTCLDLARRFRVAPAYIEHAVKFEKGVVGAEEPVSVDMIVRNLRAAAHRIHHSQFAFDQDTAGAVLFNPAFIKCDRDIEDIETRIRGLKSPRFSACMWGPPGTGKSAWARYIATDVLGMEVLFKRYSDLSSMWLGETEKNIRGAFEEAEGGNMALIIDEADSFLRNREIAQRSWEVTEVNEMLTCLERARVPVFMTTNLMRDVDPAALRRFTFKLNFNYMESWQAAACFESYFGVPAPNEIQGLRNLTPGDFDNVRKQTAILGQPSARELVGLLEEECKLKPESARQIGFMTGSTRPPPEKFARPPSPGARPSGT